MAINRTKFRKDLEEGLNAHFGMAYKEQPQEWIRIFTSENSTKAFEEDVLETGFGAAQEKAEGAGVAYDEPQQGWTSRYTNKTFALAFAITEEAIEDNLYQRLGPKYAKALARAMRHTKEINGAAILNNGFNTSFVGGDGKPLFATDHPRLDGRVGSNMLSIPADLSEESLEEVLTMIRKANDDRGTPIALRATALVIPPELIWDATRLTRTTQRVGTADNDINAIVHKGIFASDPIEITRLTDPDAWFVKTDAPDGLKHMKRVALKRGMKGDFETGNMHYKARERYVFGWSDWHGAYGSAGSS